MPLITPITPACPKCRCANASCVESVSATSPAWFFRCSDCAYVWSVDKTLTERLALDRTT